ncbi:MAG: phosphate ABC transporter permease subunit PstC [Halorientalis sp.]
MLGTIGATIRENAPVDAGDAGHIWVVGGLSLALAFALFFVGSRFTVLPLAAFVVTVGYGWYAHQAGTAKGLTLLTTVFAVLILVLIVVFLVARSIPAFSYMGIDILTKTSKPFWNTSGEEVYSLVPMIVGTLTTTAIAMVFAAPLGVASALFISEIAPDWAREIVKPGVELMAGIPSIVYGFIGFAIINEFMYSEMRLPGFGSYIAVGLVIGIMALPTVVSVAEDALAAVPESMKSGSLAMGATDWQTMKNVTVPAAFSGVSAAVLLGVGRAIGETMAATVMLGHTKLIPDPLYDVFANGETLTSVIAFEYGNASGLHMSALFAAGVILFVTVLFLSIGSLLIERRMERKLGGKA